MMPALDYWLHKDNGEVIACKNEVCFARASKLVADAQERLGWSGELSLDHVDEYNSYALAQGRQHFTYIRANIPSRFNSPAFIKFLCELPCFKDRVSVRWVSGVKFNAEHSPFTHQRRRSEHHRDRIKAMFTGYHEVTVSLNSMPVQMTFSFLSCIRYFRDYPFIIHTFDYMTDRGLHPYLSFVLSSLLDYQRLEENDWRDLDFTKSLPMQGPSGGGGGHHCTEYQGAMSIDMLDMIYNVDYSKAGEDAVIQPYSKIMLIPSKIIRFNECSDGCKLQKQLHLVEDGVLVTSTALHTDWGASNGKLNLSKLRIPELNTAVEAMIAGEVSTEIAQQGPRATIKELAHGKANTNSRGQKLRKALPSVRGCSNGFPANRGKSFGELTCSVYGGIGRRSRDVCRAGAQGYAITH